MLAISDLPLFIDSIELPPADRSHFICPLLCSLSPSISLLRFAFCIFVFIFIS